MDLNISVFSMHSSIMGSKKQPIIKTGMYFLMSEEAK